MVRFSPYTVLKTGLISGQTILKVDNYMLICSPYQFSMKRAILLLILSQEETHFFQQYKDTPCTLSLTFQKPGPHHPVIFDLKGVVDRIGPVKDKPNLCMIDVVFSERPSELTDILGNFILTYNALRGYYETFQGKEIIMDNRMARMLRFNDYMECYIGSNKIRADLVAISVSKLIFSLPSDTPDIIEGYSFSCKLYFQLYQFMVHGKIDEIEGYKRGQIRVSCSIDFAPELIEIMDDYFYRLTHSVADGLPQSLPR